MSLQLADPEADRYDGLASLNWPSPPGDEPKPIPPGAEVRVLRRGSFTTDANGMTLATNGWSPTNLMRGSLNHAWEIWVRPELERYRKEGITLPEKIRSVLIKREGDRMCLYVNVDGGIGHMVIRPGVTLKKGDPVTSDMILDVADVTPPTHEGQATQYYLVRFNGKQISVVFDMRPGQDDGPTEWSDEDCKWYGEALAEQMLAGVYGHVILAQQHLVASDIPFSLGLPTSKMNALAQAAEQGRETAEQYLQNNIDANDWKPLVSHWASSTTWARRGPLFEEALATYESGHYAATVTLLMPQVEGTIMEFLVAQGKGLRENGHSKKWSINDAEASVLGDLQEELVARDFGYVRQTIVGTLLDFLRRSPLYSRFSWRDGGEPLGRHPILHGYEVNFGAKANADRILMVLDSIFWLIGVPSALQRADEEE